jgi:erythromycin esterase-like protein
MENLIPFLSTKKVVMLGEASHGTQEFYHWRRRLTEELMAKHGFSIVAVEGDWPDCMKINEWVRGELDEKQFPHAKDVVKTFERWPTWMWCNQEICELMGWMKKFNKDKSTENQVGFFGLDVYSFFESMDAVVTRLSPVDPTLAKLAQKRYSYFSRFNRDEQKYIESLFTYPEGGKTQAVEMLRDLLRVRIEEMNLAQGRVYFDATQNARIVNNAENYYRAMIFGRDTSWNVRDSHMMETLEVLMKFHNNPKVIIWAHNTHIGDYEYTEMKQRGEVNIGGLARKKFGSDVALVGFSTYEGSVLAGRRWGAPMQMMKVPPARSDSWDALLHFVARERGEASYYFVMDDLSADSKKLLSTNKGQRAIGVVYRPEDEARGNYVPTILLKRYDALIFINKTVALQKPLEPEHVEVAEIPETFPSGF